MKTGAAGNHTHEKTEGRQTASNKKIKTNNPSSTLPTVFRINGVRGFGVIDDPDLSIKFIAQQQSIIRIKERLLPKQTALNPSSAPKY
jgi:hypothetical protein